MKRRHLLASAAALGLSGTSWAQNYPSKAVRLVVPYAPGGGLDVFNRPMSIKLAELIRWDELEDDYAAQLDYC